VVASLSLDLVDNAGVDLDLVALCAIMDWHLHTTIALANGCEDGVLLEARDAIMAVGNKPDVVAGPVAGQVKGVEVRHGMLRIAKVWAIIGVVDPHLHAIPLDADCIDTCFLQALDEDIAGDDLVASDQSLWVLGAKQDDVSRDEDMEEGSLELGMDLHIEDALANTDPVLEGGVILDGGGMADKLNRGHGLEHLQQVLGVEADVPCIKVTWSHEWPGDLMVHPGRHHSDGRGMGGEREGGGSLITGWCVCVCVLFVCVLFVVDVLEEMLRS